MMKARWVVRQGPDEGFGAVSLGTAIIASWWPRRYYKVSTIQLDTSSIAAKALESLKTAVPLRDVPFKVTGYVSQVVKCDRNGFAGRWDNPLYEREYSDASQARAGHEKIVSLLEKGRLTLR